MPAAMILVLAFVLGILVPAPAFAAPPEEDIADIPVPESIPAWVWRADTRHPTEWIPDDDGVGIPPIFEDGFRPKGQPGSWNDNLADHVLNTEQPNRSAWVSTSYDQDEAISFGKSNLGDEFWEYRLAPDENFWSVQTSFKNALLPDGEYDEALADRFEAAKDSWYGDVQGEAEFAAYGEISEKNIAEARQWVRDADGDWVIGETHQNPRFTRPERQPTLDPYEIPDEGVCYGNARATCAPPIDDEDALADLHGDRFDGGTDDFDFSLRTDELREDEALLLAPAPESVDIVADYAAGSHTPSDFTDFTDELADSFEADTAALSEVTTETSVIDSVAESMDIVVDTSAEILPYFGIAATGWALKEDISHGDWGDFAADSIAEGLQSAMVVAPEFDFILAPLLFVDVIAKEIGDWAWSLLHPAPEYSEAYRNQLEKANDQVDKAPGLLLDAWKTERDEVFSKFYGDKVESRLADTVTAKIQSDIAVLTAMDRAVSREIVRHEFRARAVAETDTERMRVRVASVAAQTDLRAVTQAAVKDRVAQYRDRYAAVIGSTADSTWNLDLDEIAKQFTEDEKVAGYLTKVSEIASEAYFEKPFDQLSPWDKEVARARGEEERAALKALVPAVEQSRLWAGPDDWERARYTTVLRDTVERAVADSVKLPALPKATTLGVHDLTVKPDSGTTFGPASAGTVSWQQQIGSSAIPIDAKTGDTVTWTIDLPAQLVVRKLPTLPTTAGWSLAWKQHDGDVSLTATKTSEPADGFARQQRYEFEVVFEGVPVAPTVSAAFTPPVGQQSLAQVGFVELPLGDFEAIESEASEITGTKAKVRFTARATADTYQSLRWMHIETENVQGLRFPTSGTISAWRRAADGIDWVRHSALDLRRTGASSAKLAASSSSGVVILDAGDLVRWEVEVEVTSGPDARIAIPYTLTTDMGFGRSATKSTARVGGTSALTAVQMPVPELAYNSPVAVPIAARVTGSAMRSVGATTVEFRAPEGSTFASGEDIVPVTASGTKIPNATVRNIRPSGDGRILTGSITGGTVDLAVGTQLQWKPLVQAHTKPSGKTAVGYSLDGTASNGPIRLDGTQSVSLPDLPTVDVSVAVNQPIKPGESTWTRFSVRPSEAVRGLQYSVTAPSNAFFATDVVKTSDAREYTGQFNRDRTELTVVIPDELSTNGSTISTLLALAPDAVEFPFVEGRFQASGPVSTAQVKFRMQFADEEPEVPDPGAADIEFSSDVVNIPQREDRSISYKLKNTGTAPGSFNVGVRLPDDYNVVAPNTVSYRIGSGSVQTVVAPLNGRIFRLDDLLPTLRPGETLTISFPLRNNGSGWDEVVSTELVEVTDRDTRQKWNKFYQLRSVLGADMLTVQCYSSRAGLAEARIRWFEHENGYYKATIEQSRITTHTNFVSDNAVLGIWLHTDGYEGAWATKSVPRTGEWVSGGPGAWAYIRKPKLLAGLLDVEFDDWVGLSPVCQSKFTIFKN